MAALTLQHVTDTGAAPTFAAASVSDTAIIGNGQNTILVYRNSGVSPVSVTVVAPGNTDYGVGLPEKTVSIPAAVAGVPGSAWIPLRKSYAGDGGLATATLVDATGITVAVVRLG